MVMFPPSIWAEITSAGVTPGIEHLQLENETVSRLLYFKDSCSYLRYVTKVPVYVDIVTIR